MGGPTPGMKKKRDKVIFSEFKGKKLGKMSGMRPKTRNDR